MPSRRHDVPSGRRGSRGRLLVADRGVTGADAEVTRRCIIAIVPAQVVRVYDLRLLQEVRGLPSHGGWGRSDVPRALHTWTVPELIASVTITKSQCWLFDADGSRHPASAMRSSAVGDGVR